MVKHSLFGVGSLRTGHKYQTVLARMELTVYSTVLSNQLGTWVLNCIDRPSWRLLDSKDRSGWYLLDSRY